MNTFQYLVLFYVGLTCLTMGLCSPVKQRQARSHPSGHDKHKTRSSGKRLKILQKMLKQLQPDDIDWLLRQKKFSAYRDIYDKGTVHYNDADNEIDSRKYDILEDTTKEIECPTAEDGVPLFACPTPDKYGTHRCIDEHALCDSRKNCPNGEDEDRTVCMFHKMTMRYFKVMMDALYGLTRSLV